MIIGISGKIGAGKTTLARALLSHLGSDPRDKLCSFAGPLKESAVSVFGLRRDLVYGSQDDKLSDTQFFTAPHRIVTPETPVTYREFLQKWGEWCRAWDVDFWVKQAIAAARDVTRIAVFDDVRFPNEADAIRATGGVVIRLTRAREPLQTHVSETALDKYAFDCIAPNHVMTPEQTLTEVLQWLQQR